MANGEAEIKSAKTADDKAVAYDAYKKSMEANGQTPKSLKDILGK